MVLSVGLSFSSYRLLKILEKYFGDICLEETKRIKTIFIVFTSCYLLSCFSFVVSVVLLDQGFISYFIN